MTMIEKAESIIGCEGACFDYITFKCTECPIHDNCPTGEEETVKAAKAYLYDEFGPYRYRKIQQEPSVEDMAQEYYRNALNPTRIEMYIAGYNKAKETL